MPGLVVFRRRWSVGSDDMVVPAVLLLILHSVWLIILSIIFGLSTFDHTRGCSVDLQIHILGYIVLMAACLLLELVIAIVSMRGSILDVKPRTSMQYLMYARLAVCLGEVTWLVLGIKWLAQNYSSCHHDKAGDAVLGINVFQVCMMILSMITLCCAFDTAGRKWVKMKKYQESMKEKTRRSRRSGSARRNWRQRSLLYQYFYEKMERKAFRAYEESWDRRFRLLCCCVERKGRNKNSMSEIAQIFTEFFRDLDVVPSDVIAGLVLLRRYQKLRMQHYCQLDNNDTYRYLSGIPVTPRTQFLQLSQPEVLQQYQLVIHYMRYAMAAYGWPIFMMMNTGTGLCKLMPYLSCCCCKMCCSKKMDASDPVVSDNCCECNMAALRQISGLKNIDLVFVTYHVDIGETPFFVALDNKYKKIVICVRGTLSLQDVLTDLKADAETLPLDPGKEDWIGHKGMVQAAIYIKKKLDEDILAKAFEKCKEKGSEKYGLVLVGHSLGAGTAAILAIMLQQEYTDLHCYSYSPPGGLLSYECVEETKSFITSVVIGKDVVPRIGLPQMELLRTDLINIIKKSRNPKWKIIIKALCCGSESASQITYEEVKADVERDVTAHPSDQEIGLTAHKPMYPPGKIILVVRNHPSRDKKQLCCGSKEPVYQAIWADNSDFQEVLVSPTMVNDHMPDNVMEALQKVLVNVAPPKPTRLLSEAERKALLTHDLSPGTPVSLDSQKTPMFESRASTLNHGQDLYNMHWDMLNEDLLLSLEKENLFPELYEFPRLELDLDTTWISAPLASPEVLSESSSAISLDNSAKNRHSSSTSVRLETIQQSPDMKVKIDTPSKGSLDSVTKTGAVSVNIHTSDTAEVEESLNVKNHCVRQTLSNGNADIEGVIANGSNEMSRSPKIAEIHKPISDEIQLSDFHVVNIDQNSHLNQSSPKFQSSPLSHVDSVQAECDIHLSNGHSPFEDSDFSHQDRNNHASPVHTQHNPENLGARKPSPRRHQSPKVPSPANKRLHYSQSESYIETLSDKYQMKRSKEQGDIAHLKDTTKVYEANTSKSHDKQLKPRESEPIFEESKLPQVHSAILETMYGEIDENLLMAVAENETDEGCLKMGDNIEVDNSLTELESAEAFNGEIGELIDNVLNETESVRLHVSQTDNADETDSTLTLEDTSKHVDTTVTGDSLAEAEPNNIDERGNENLPYGESDCLLPVDQGISSTTESEYLPAVAVYEPLVKSVDSLLEDDNMESMFSKTTRLSVDGTYSGSEKRSSSSGQSTSGHSISGHSDEYPMTETDV